MVKTKIFLVSFLSFLLLSLPITFATTLNQTFVYDGNGNLVSGYGKNRTYNGFNQLIRVTDSLTGDVLEEYIYHPTEDRILVKKVNVDVDGNNFEETIVYVNDNFVRRYDLVGIRERNDTYYIKDESGIVAEVIFNDTVQFGGSTQNMKLFYHNDHLGSTSVITNSSGSIVEETFYAPYGEILEGGEVSRFDYEGKEFSSFTKDYDYNFRKYNPEIGIFMQPEQIFPNVYDPQQLNRYGFERRNPYLYIDENGKDAVRFYGSTGISLPQQIGAQFSAGMAYSYSKEYGFQIAPSFSYGGGLDVGAIISPIVIGGEYTKEAKQLRDIEGVSLSKGGNIAKGLIGGGISLSESAEGEGYSSISPEYSLGYGAHYYEYETNTFVSPVVLTIKEKRPRDFLDLFLPGKPGLPFKFQIQYDKNLGSRGGSSKKIASGSGGGKTSTGGVYTKLPGGKKCKGICVR